MGWSETTGLGFFLDGQDETLRFSHGGDNDGYKCKLVAYRDISIGAVVMTNGDGGWTLHEEIIRTLAAEIGWPGFLPPRRSAVSVDVARLERYAGTYELKPGFRLIITLQDAALVLEGSGQPSMQLHAMSDSRLFAEAVNIELSFEHDNAGVVSGLTMYQNGSELAARKVS